MRKQWKERLGCVTLALVLSLGAAGPAWAVDGVIEINQAKAEKGGVTPGDDPGFPVTISLAGSYRLTGNLKPGEGKTAIQITASHVTLDLNGFAIIGSGGDAGRGVDAGGAIRNVTVLNGTVIGMGKEGIFIFGDARIEKVRALANGSTGIRVGGFSTVNNNTAVDNRGDFADEGHGIDAGPGSTVSGNTANRNRRNGIDVEGGSTVLGNTARSNMGFGLFLRENAAFNNNVLTGNKGTNNPADQVSGGSSLTHNRCGNANC